MNGASEAFETAFPAGRAFLAGLLLLIAGTASAEILVYLNPCADDCTYSPGFEDAVADTSSIIGQQRTLSAFSHGNAAFDAIVACAEGILAPFNLRVTLVDPSPQPHLEIAIAGTPADAGFPSGVGAVAPSACSYIPNSIAFVFANVYAAQDTSGICWAAMAQLGTLAGLEPLFHCPDVMSHLSGCGDKAFRDEVVSCGTISAQSCVCGGSTRNSFAVMQSVFPPDDIFLDGFEEP